MRRLRSLLRGVAQRLDSEEKLLIHLLQEHERYVLEPVKLIQRSNGI